MFIVQIVYLYLSDFFKDVDRYDDFTSNEASINITLLSMLFGFIKLVGGLLFILSNGFNFCIKCTKTSHKTSHNSQPITNTKNGRKCFYLEVKSKSIKKYHCYSHYLIESAISKSISIDKHLIETLHIVPTAKNGIKCKIVIKCETKEDVKNYKLLGVKSGVNVNIKVGKQGEIRENLKEEIVQSLKLKNGVKITLKPFEGGKIKSKLNSNSISTIKATTNGGGTRTDGKKQKNSNANSKNTGKKSKDTKMLSYILEMMPGEQEGDESKSKSKTEKKKDKGKEKEKTKETGKKKGKEKNTRNSSKGERDSRKRNKKVEEKNKNVRNKKEEKNTAGKTKHTKAKKNNDSSKKKKESKKKSKNDSKTSSKYAD